MEKNGEDWRRERTDSSEFGVLSSEGTEEEKVGDWNTRVYGLCSEREETTGDGTTAPPA
jgi:hypothetical protein